MSDDVLQGGLDWLEGQRRAHMSRTVTYRRGASTVEAPGTRAAARYEEDGGHRNIVEQGKRH